MQINTAKPNNIKEKSEAYNVICLVVDSVKLHSTHTYGSKTSTTPFLDTLLDESIVTTNLYSQGPYTDAATKGLYTGRNALDDFGYYFKLNTAPSTHFEVFHNNGYETYGMIYPYYIIGNRIKKCIDHTYYTSAFSFSSSEWGGIYGYYADILRSRELNKCELQLLRKRLKLTFQTWIAFYDDCINNTESSKLILKGIEDFDIGAALKVLKGEEELFETSPDEYIKSMLTKKSSCILWDLDKIDIDTYINRNFINNCIYKKHKKFFTKIKVYNVLSNLYYNRPHIKRVINKLGKFIKSKNKDDLRFAANFLHCLKAPKAIEVNSQKTKWQLEPSAARQFECAEEFLSKRSDSTKPFYLSIHVEEPHENVSYFSYDIEDQNKLDKEIEVLSEFIDSTGTDFRGSLPYLLSIRYTDYCIENFCNALKQMGLWNNTILMVVADHGSSYSYYPLHNQQVNCFDDECYHIPMLIRVPNDKGRVITDYHNSKDVFPTLFEVAGIEAPPSFTGTSMLGESIEKNYVMTEYMGPGCPDMLSRRIWFSIRDEKVLIAYKVGIYEPFENGELSQVYILTEDPNAFNNVCDSIDTSSIEPYLQIIKKRYQEIKQDTLRFINEVQREGI